MLNNIKESKWQVKVSGLVIFILYFFLILGSLNATESNTILIGVFSIFISLLISLIGFFIYLFKGKKLVKTQLFILLLTCILFFTCTISILNNTVDIADIVNTLQIILSIILVLYISFIKIEYSDIKRLNILACFFILFHFLVWIYSSMPNMFASIYNNSNLVGPFIFYTTFFLIIGLKFSKIKPVYIVMLIISLIIIISSDTRSALLSAFVTIIVFLFWSFITKNKVIALLFFLILIAGSLALIFIYPILPKFSFFMPLEQWMLTYTGKSIMSGRNDLWVPLIELINQRPILGYSPSTMASELFATDQSPHNLFLNILMQIGYLGLMSILLIFLLIWMAFVKVKNNFIVKLSGSYFVGIIVHQSFEITLFQNQLSIGLLQLFIIAIGLSVAVNSINKKDYIQSNKV